MNRNTKSATIIGIFLLFVFFFSIFLFVVLKIIVQDRHLPALFVTDKNRAIRGSIISSDGYQVAFSNKLYKVAVDTRSIDPAKKEIFIKLFSIYSGIEAKKIRKALRKKGYTVISYNIDTKTAYQLKILARKFYQMDFFVPFKVGNRVYKRGMEIVESGETRVYPYKDALTPVVGYVKKVDGRYTSIKGAKGIEKFYERSISPKQDGIIRGRRDIGNNIILNKEAFIKKRIDGYNVHLNVNMLLQKSLEHILDIHRLDQDADEIIAAVMESKTGKIIAIASTSRYDPKNIRQRDISSLNAKFVEYIFEPGSVMKPITFALLLEKKMVNPYEVINGHNGRFKIGRKTITDEHKFDWLSAENVIIYSSNIGIAQLAQRLTPVDFYKGLKNFGFGRPSGVDLPRDLPGTLIPVVKFRSQIYKATVAYGYGIRTTFMQLLKAYNVFNNEGIEVQPRIADFLSTAEGKKLYLNPPKKRRIISVATAATMKNILQKVVEKGTGTVAKIEGLIIGGKTGTAQIATRGGYGHNYNSSFFGFANDAKHRYTIGVTVIRPKTKHFASQTAVPVFRDIVIELINEGYLQPEASE
ncbi:penicillin-binding protein 2 [Nitratiruptor sp. YY09-18]|uniref:peptidoglycan D,D-transpeptidase FtsI family protein n=1 Tax=Nitratiruptor sp. YY09-18 TaxID=2724901 RepID=UPI001916573B|nr:penicillin-binding protein 2 [Nitratiruptor sp. YY09-18]BCD68633.1 cell division protein FtsI [Nitratiruptor sp. YY09-18]